MSEQERLLEIIESFRRKNHYYVDGDCWYSCPAHEDYCGDDKRVCRCGLAEHNAKVDEAWQIVRGLIQRAADEAMIPDEKYCFDCRQWFTGEHDCPNQLRR